MLPRSLLIRALRASAMGSVKTVSSRRIAGIVPQITIPTSRLTLQIRFNSSSKDNSVPIGQIKVDKPMLMIAFTCKKCDTRSSHSMSKQAYTGGTVLIKCPGCNNRHLIADHLKIFSDDRITIEDILAEKGESASLTPDDLAFEDIPEKLKGLIGHHAKDAPAEYRRENSSEESPMLEDGSQHTKEK